MPFEIKGADGQTIAIPDGEYYFNTKARARRMMLNSLSPEARRIHACLELATMGFRQELAVTMDGVKVPLTNAHIQTQTGLSKQNVRRGLAELEAAGLVERRGINGGPLHKGKIEIYSWAEPREPKRENGSQRATTIPVWFPTSWEPIRTLITRYKYRLPPDLEAARDYIPALETAARDYERAENVVTELLERVCAPTAIYKEERTERTTERTAAAEAPAPSPAAVVLDALSKYGKTDLDTAERVINRCREQYPKATEDQILQMIHEKGAGISSKTKKPVAFLVDVVPRAFKGYVPPPPTPTTTAKQPKEIEALEWLAENDEDPAVREYAADKLRELGIERSLAHER